MKVEGKSQGVLSVAPSSPQKACQSCVQGVRLAEIGTYTVGDGGRVHEARPRREAHGAHVTERLHDTLSCLMIARFIGSLILLGGWAFAMDRGEEIRLWPQGAPGSEGEKAPEVFRACQHGRAAQAVHCRTLSVDLCLPAAEREGQRNGRGHRAWWRPFAACDR